MSSHGLPSAARTERVQFYKDSCQTFCCREWLLGEERGCREEERGEEKKRRSDAALFDDKKALSTENQKGG